MCIYDDGREIQWQNRRKVILEHVPHLPLFLAREQRSPQIFCPSILRPRHTGPLIVLIFHTTWGPPFHHHRVLIYPSSRCVYPPIRSMLARILWRESFIQELVDTDQSCGDGMRRTASVSNSTSRRSVGDFSNSPTIECSTSISLSIETDVS